MSSLIRFGPYALDVANAALRRGEQPVELPPKAFNVLCHLAERPGQLVTKDQLLDAVWGHRHVSESVLKMAIVSIRQSLGDDPKAPRFVETVARRGYRFVSAGAPAAQPAPAPLAVGPIEPVVAATLPVTAGPVGLAEGLAAIDAQLGLAMTGQRRLMLVSGEAGMGKSTLLRHWRARHEATVRIGGGQCVEQYGAGEPYLPLLDALNDLGSGSGRAALVEALRDLAPTWWEQMPWLVPPAERAGLRGLLASSSSARMLRELGELLDRLCEDGPVALLLEDLHWVDHATVQALDFLARRRGGARLLILCTTRAGELAEAQHPLGPAWQEWRAQRICRDWALATWSEADIARFAQEQLGESGVDRTLVRALAAHTEGLPLFVASVLEHLHEGGHLVREGGLWRAREGALSRLALPQTVAGMIERQIARLPMEHRALLEAASVVGVRFELDGLAAALDRPPAEVQAQCDLLARRGLWLRAEEVTSQAGDALTVRWRFGHALRHRVFYESTAPAWRIALHRRLATRMSACWPHDDRDAPYADLAHHRARGLQHAEAAQAYRQASLRAERRQAHHEAHSLSVEGMAQLALLPAEEQAAQADLHRVLELQHALNLILLYGAADPRAAAAAERSLERHADVAGNLDWMSACRAVLLAEHAQGRFDAAAKRSMHAVALTRSRGDLPALYSALGIHGRTLFKCGRFDEARAALNEALAIQTAHADALRSAIGHDDLSRVVRWFLVLLDQVQGRPSEPDDPSLSALLELCRSFEAPLTRIWSHLLAAMVMAWRGDAQSAGAAMRAAEREAERVERDFACNQQAMVQAWAQARGEPAAITSAWQRFEAAYALYRSSGERHLESGFFAALRSEMLIQQQRLEDAKATVVTALKEIESSGERCHLTTLERLLKTLHALQQ